MPSGSKFESVLRCHSGDILNYYASDKRVSSFVPPASQSNLALRPLFESFSPEGENIAELTLKPIRTRPAQYPKISCSRYPLCHELTVKIFVQTVVDDLVESAVSQILSELEFNFIDHVILSFDKEESDENVDAIWLQLVQEKKLGRAHSIGVADFCKHKLERLIASTGIKPDVVQLYPKACNGFCGISPGLMDFAKEQDIKLKSHGDPCCAPHLMSQEINSLVQKTNPQWKPMFVSRYSQVSKDRLCITKKGFVAQYRIY